MKKWKIYPKCEFISKYNEDRRIKYDKIRIFSLINQDFFTGLWHFITLLQTFSALFRIFSCLHMIFLYVLVWFPSGGILKNMGNLGRNILWINIFCNTLLKPICCEFNNFSSWEREKRENQRAKCLNLTKKTCARPE